jgi:hypothetical protein
LKYFFGNARKLVIVGEIFFVFLASRSDSVVIRRCLEYQEINVPRKRNPKLEKQRQAQERVRERNAVVGVPESCVVDAAISAALYVHVMECTASRTKDPTISRLLTIARDILASAKAPDGTEKYNRDICDQQVRHRASQRRPGDRAEFLRVRSEMVRRKREKVALDAPF